MGKPKNYARLVKRDQAAKADRDIAPTAKVKPPHDKWRARREAADAKAAEIKLARGLGEK